MSTTRLGVQKILDHKLGLLGFFGHPRRSDFTSQVGRTKGENGRGGQVSESKPFFRGAVGKVRKSMHFGVVRNGEMTCLGYLKLFHRNWPVKTPSGAK